MSCVFLADPATTEISPLSLHDALPISETGVSRSALRAWYRNGEIPSRLADGPNGPQRLVPLDAVIDRAARSPRIQRRDRKSTRLNSSHLGISYAVFCLKKKKKKKTQKR